LWSGDDPLTMRQQYLQPPLVRFYSEVRRWSAHQRNLHLG